MHLQLVKVGGGVGGEAIAAPRTRLFRPQRDALCLPSSPWYFILPVTTSLSAAFEVENEDSDRFSITQVFRSTLVHTVKCSLSSLCPVVSNVCFKNGKHAGRTWGQSLLKPMVSTN